MVHCLRQSPGCRTRVRKAAEMGAQTWRLPPGSHSETPSVPPSWLGERIPAAELSPSKWSLKDKTKGTGHKEPQTSSSATGERRHSAVG